MGSKSVTIKDVAREAKCSIATVSCVLNNTNRISETMREHVRATCKKMGYYPSSAGRNLRNRKTESIGILFYPSCARIFCDGFYSKVMQGLEEELTRANHNLILAGFDLSIQQEGMPKFIREGSVDGVILMGGCPEAFKQKLLDINLPFLLLDADIPGSAIDSITSDGFSAMATMVSHLRDKGHRRLLMIHHSFNNYNEASRREGFQAECQKLGLAYEIERVDTNDQATQAIINRLEGDHPITAACMVNDSMAVDISGKLSAAGVKIPEQISITGFDDSQAAISAYTRLTTMRVDHQLMGAEGARTILKRINDAEAPARKLLIPTELVERKSVARLHPDG